MTSADLARTANSEDEGVLFVRVHASKPMGTLSRIRERAAPESMEQRVPLPLTIVLSETLGLQLYGVVRGGIESISEP